MSPQGFQPTYVTDAKKRSVIAEIAAAARTAEAIFLATDPDREGEAIAWHVQEAAGLDPARTRRISFNQVTPEAVRQALAAPRDLDRDLIAAQEARRVLDRLVGYQISPLLGTRHAQLAPFGRAGAIGGAAAGGRARARDPGLCARGILDAGRPLAAAHDRTRSALRRACSRCVARSPACAAKTRWTRILRELEGADYVVTRVQPGRRQRNPQPPFITSTLQAEAGSKLGFNSRRTMRIAQQLYEGIELGGEMVGLITYMRTDSTHVAPEAQQEARDYIIARWGAEYAPAQPPVYRSKVANAQEAHEAIRPTAVARTPQEIKPFLEQRAGAAIRADLAAVCRQPDAARAL